jgi:hypothetical protein
MDRNEAIKIVKGYYPVNKQILNEALKFLIPELKESEDENADEKVRKALIKLVTNHASMDLFIEYDIHLDEALSWLEKQGKNNMGISEATRQKLEDSLNKALEKETPESWNKFLDEQGEQKTVSKVKIGEKYRCCNSVRYTCFQIGKVYEVKDSFDAAMISLCSDCFVLVDDSVEQKPVNKVEPKFRVGDTIRLKGSYAEYTIESVSDGHYYGNGFSFNIAGCDRDYELVEQKPAEVRTTGYWHVEDVEQKPWSEEDDAIRNDLINYFRGSALETPEKEVINFLESLKDRIVPQSKQVWSEEDEQWWKVIAQTELTEAAKDWIRTLIDRATLQPKQVWSEEDKKMHDFALRAIGLCKQYAINNQINGYSKLPDTPQKYEELYQWLKSLKERYTWKPSDEQLKALKEIIDVGHFTSYPNALETLYEQLKKLK